MGVCVALGIFVFVNVGRGVWVEVAVHVDVGVGGIACGKIWYATGLAKTAATIVNINSINETPSHCCPATIRARRVR